MCAVMRDVLRAAGKVRGRRGHGDVRALWTGPVPHGATAQTAGIHNEKKQRSVITYFIHSRVIIDN